MRGVGFGPKLKLAEAFKATQPARKGVASTQVAVQGASLTSDAFRQQLVARLAAGGGVHEAVLAAVGSVPRHGFVDAALASQAYEDTSLPIGFDQTISKPSVVARMLSLLLDAPGLRNPLPHADSRWPVPARVLEIGTGCGYQAALLAQLAMHVSSVERIAGLHQKAKANLFSLGYRNLQLSLGDGMLGQPGNAPYMGIIAAAGGDAVPAAWMDQLAPGGRIVAPVEAADGQQWLTVLDKTAQGIQTQRLAIVRFVPLKSGIR
jgi:protein-L-isoaspartate(D-aspartate) O-methyltransferase